MTQFALLVDGQVAEVFPALIQIDGVGIPITERYHPEFIAGLVPYDPENPPPAPVPPEPTVEELEAAARERRDAELRASDWSQLVDVPEATRAAWAPYRQALREVPQQKTFPKKIKWPAAPG